jgi:hypothetical protein
MAQLAVVLLALFGQINAPTPLSKPRTLARSPRSRAPNRTARGIEPHKIAYAVHLHDTGDTIAEIITKTGITRSNLYRHLPPRPAESITAADTDPAEVTT